MSDEIVGVILTAGKGTRLGELRTRLPKAVLPVLDRPIAYYHLLAMAELGMSKAYIVVGHRSFEVVRELERQPDPGLEVVYIDQEETLGIAHSVGRLEPHIDSPFLLFLGDIYFHAPRLGEMVEIFNRGGVDGVLGAREEPDVEALCKNFVILTDDEGRATRVIEKPRHPPGNVKGVGVYLFSPVIFDAIRRTPRTAMRDEYEITDAIQIAIDDGHHIRPALCIEQDLNVTYPRDLLEINLEALDRAGLERHLGEGAEVEDGASIRRSVVGSEARIGAGASLSDSIVFRGVSVEPGETLERAIVTEMGIHHI